MDNQIKTSFIPRKTMDTPVSFSSGTTVPRRVGQTVFSIIATCIFLGILIFSGLIFAWQLKLQKNIENQIMAMEEARKDFDEKFIDEASRLDTRIEQAQGMLANHVSPSALYSLLEEYTLQTVSFSKFSFKDNQDGSIGITGSGEAKHYESIVLQSDAFGKSGYLRNVIFTNLKSDQNNQNVTFSFEATLNPELILYRKSLEPVLTNDKK